MANTAPNISKMVKDARTLVRRGASASDVAESLTHNIKSTAIIELSRQKAQSLQKLIRQEEAKLNETIAKSFEEKNQKKAKKLTAYYEELSNYYYSSTTKTATDLKTDIIPLFEELVQDLEKDTILSDEEKAPLFDIIKKTTDIFKKRLTLQARLTESSNKILGANVRGGMTRSGLGVILLATYDIYQKQKDRKQQKEEKQEATENAKREARIRRQTRTGGPSPRQTSSPKISKPSLSAPTETKPEQITPQASATPVASSDISSATEEAMDIPKTVQVKPYTKADGTEVAGHSRRRPYEAQLVGVLTQHSKILGSILQISSGIKETLIVHSKNLENIDIATSKQFKLFEKKFAQEQLAAEEQGFETANFAKALSLASNKKSAEKLPQPSDPNSLLKNITQSAIGTMLAEAAIPALAAAGGILGPAIAALLTTGVGLAIGGWVGTWMRKEFGTDEWFAKKGPQWFGDEGAEIEQKLWSPEMQRGEHEGFASADALQRVKDSRLREMGVAVSTRGEIYKNKKGLYEFIGSEGDKKIYDVLAAGPKFKADGTLDKMYESALDAINQPIESRRQLKDRLIKEGKLEAPVTPTAVPVSEPTAEELEIKRLNEYYTLGNGMVRGVSSAEELATLEEPTSTPSTDLVSEAAQQWRVEEAQKRISTPSTPTAQKVPLALENMTASDNISNLIEKMEGFSEVAIPDEGGWAIGHGLNYWDGKKVSPTWPGRAVTEEESRQQKRKMFKGFEDRIKKTLKVSVTQNEFDALVSVAYNKGNADDLVRKLNKGQTLTYEDFAASAAVKRDGVRKRAKDVGLWGLEMRRAKEYAMFSDRTDLMNILQGKGKAPQLLEKFSSAIGQPNNPSTDLTLAKDVSSAGRQELTNNLQAGLSPQVNAAQPVVVNNVYNDNRVSSANVKKDAGLDTRNHDNTLRRSLGG